MVKKYTQDYYQKHLAGALSSAESILRLLSSFYKPSSVLDLGCGSGAWLKVAKRLFHSRVLGVDQHSYQDIKMLIQPNEYMVHNLETPLFIREKFDLVISLEVAEHITENCEDVLIDSVCRHGDVILFSAALPMQGGTGHINEKACSYWALKFAKNDYYAIDCIRPRIWDNSNVEIWYRNNAILFASKKQKNELEKQLSLIKYPLDIIHPQMLERIVSRRK